MIDELRKSLTCEVRDDQVSKQLYSSDASIYCIEPVAIVLPRSKEELIQAVQIASKMGIPIIPRGAATGVVGGCLGKGLIIDCAQHLSRIIEINPEERYAIVQPGCVLDQLNAATAPYGLCFGPDTSTSNRVTIGGMVSTNASGSHSLLYGTTQDNVLEIELVLGSGEVVRSQSIDGHLYHQIEAIKEEFEKDIAAHFPKIHRRASGYSLDVLLQDGPI
ncbi:MAG: FAD-binding oxidoreductase, partial [Verrucomicrobia bacterium]|nr:FAD-binding oxidoreductase [Verrucomicrobiota bacterium]